MNLQPVQLNKCLLWVCIPFLLLSFSTASIAGTSPKAGSYCPDTDILLVAAEELSASLDLVMGSRAALKNNKQATATSKLISAGTTLRLAASRGAAARTVLLIDAIIKDRTSEDYTQMLAWFPLLNKSVITLQDDATTNTADDLIAQAGNIMQGDNDGNPLKFLREARHMLACDDLDIPLQRAIKAQDKLLKQLGQQSDVKNVDYDNLLDSLRSALFYTLGEQ